MECFLLFSPARNVGALFFSGCRAGMHQFVALHIAAHLYASL
jgi:hypothetical protein